ncbi:MAG TPA: flagellar M-ring protein FliF, partial [Chromatiaceae bacterium]|nr:flagellar M-ring protein FliF [Chromatiaceae bacterium]
MANLQELSVPVSALGKMPVGRQIGVMVGLAASIAMGVAVALWSQTPNYTPVYGSLSGRDASQVADALMAANIDYIVEEGTGAILVQPGSVHSARMKLAAAGLPNGSGDGYELLDRETGFGQSQ